MCILRNDDIVDVWHYELRWAGISSAKELHITSVHRSSVVGDHGGSHSISDASASMHDIALAKDGVHFLQHPRGCCFFLAVSHV
jgi:hypothetical protein